MGLGIDMLKSIPCTMMRAGTSKGVYFLKSDLPENDRERDRVLLQIMGSPDKRQVDGIGGANPLTSKVAIINKSERPGVDVDYLFAQVFVDEPIVGYGQNCGNILAGVGQFAIEKGLVVASDPTTDIVVYMINSGDEAIITLMTPDKVVTYEGDTSIDGVLGKAAPVSLNFLNTAGSFCGLLLPTGNSVDIIDSIKLTCIDNGMPLVIMQASDFGITGNETIEQLETNKKLAARIENIRLQAGPMMNLGDVRDQAVPKMMLVSMPRNGGIIATRSFIPHRCHSTIGVFAAVTVATACFIPGTQAAIIAGELNNAGTRVLIEHPGGAMEVDIEVEISNDNIKLKRSGFLRTARKLYEGKVFITEKDM
jgi:4-oxalomesaconate tautomerase